jgi:iron only hydrogenase large subunit-like protein
MQTHKNEPFLVSQKDEIFLKTFQELVKALNKKEKIVAMLAPSFVAEFNYPEIIIKLRKIGFDKITELTFGAKMVNREYHKQLHENKKLLISSVCWGIVETVNNKFPKYKENLAKIDSPLIASAKICKKIYPKHKTCFISPCFFKKIEAQKSNCIDFCLTYKELKDLFHLRRGKLKKIHKKNSTFDKFYNEYTRIYPLSGGLSKTAHLKGHLKLGEDKTIDGIQEVEKFLNKPDKKVKFLDVTFCKGGCVGGPCLSTPLTLDQRVKKVIDYVEKAKNEKVPKYKKGTIEKAEGIKFSW